MDIKPPAKAPKPKPKPQKPEKPQEIDLKPSQQKALEEFVPEAAGDKQPPDAPPPKGRPNAKKIIGAVAAGLVLLLAVVALWGYFQTTPPDKDGHGRRVTIEAGQSPAEMARQLEQEGIIRSALAFRLYTSWHELGSQLQAGTYVLSPSQSLADVVTYLAEGRVDALRVTVLPGLTINELTEELVKDYGFKRAEVTAALDAQYDHPLLARKPARATLEGYIYPETYEVTGNAAPEALFKKAFDELWEQIQTNKLLKKIKSRGFSLHQGVILASIIQREVSQPADQRQVSQVFQARLKKDMPLGADATFVYAAKQLGVEPSVDIKSPYNTRIHKGLTPGPISNFNLTALQAVANPAKGDYLYFVSGDDGKTHYARTLKEHEANVARYCKKLCDMF